MADKSPRQHLQKKTAGKSLKEKRLDKKAKADTSTRSSRPPRSTDRRSSGAGARLEREQVRRAPFRLLGVQVVVRTDVPLHLGVGDSVQRLAVTGVAPRGTASTAAISSVGTCTRG